MHVTRVTKRIITKSEGPWNPVALQSGGDLARLATNLGNLDTSMNLRTSLHDAAASRSCLRSPKHFDMCLTQPLEVLCMWRCMERHNGHC
jgi:hypothetical protein